MFNSLYLFERGERAKTCPEYGFCFEPLVYDFNYTLSSVWNKNN